VKASDFREVFGRGPDIDIQGNYNIKPSHKAVSMQIQRREQQQNIIGNLPLVILPIASFLLQYVHQDIPLFVLILVIGFAGFVMDVISIFTERWKIAALSLLVGIALWAYFWPMTIAIIQKTVA
jgi:hypothetical protein